VDAVIDCFTHERTQIFEDGHKEFISGSLFECIPPSSGVTYLIDKPCQTLNAPSCDTGCEASDKEAHFHQIGSAKYLGNPHINA
jgi:hypothetical protein